jgi:hypothetical protein
MVLCDYLAKEHGIIKFKLLVRACKGCVMSSPAAVCTLLCYSHALPGNCHQACGISLAVPSASNTYLFYMQSLLHYSLSI